MAPGRYFHTRFPKSSTPTSTTSSNKSDTASNTTFELSIVGLPAPRSRCTSKNNEELTNQRRALKSAPINAAKSAIKSQQRCDKRVERPWTSCKKKPTLQNAWSLKKERSLDLTDDEISLPGAVCKLEIEGTSRKGSAKSSFVSQCSVSASSAGDVSSLGDESNSQYSQAKSELEEGKMIARKKCSFAKEDKFSFPVQARAVEEKLLKTRLQSDDEEEILLLDEGKILARQRSEVEELEDEFHCVQISREGSGQQLAHIQEKVLELLENQQACTRQTWLVLQQLSANLDFMTKKSFSEEQKRLMGDSQAPGSIPETLLLKEAAGCALRLADILSLIGSSMSTNQANEPLKLEEAQGRQEIYSSPPAFPASATDLQKQKERLRPVSSAVKFSRQGSLMEQLSASLALRRARICHSDQDHESTGSDDWAL